MTHQTNHFKLPSGLNGVRIAILGAILWLVRYACLETIFGVVFSKTLDWPYALVVFFGYPCIASSCFAEVVDNLQADQSCTPRWIVVARVLVFDSYRLTKSV